MQDLSRRAADDPPRHGVRGWCPTAWRPMMAGDGLLVRVRPPLGRMSRTQTCALCEAALRFGNGHIDLTNRAALQIRGVRERDHPAVVETLLAWRLTDPDPVREARAAVMLNPDWTAGDATESIGRALLARLRELPDMPAKIGFAIDAGAAPALIDAPADFRIERGMNGGLILRADGRAKGAPVSEEKAPDALIAIAHWFAASGGIQSGRMARHMAPLPLPATEPPAPARLPSASIARAPGAFHGAPFGRMEAATLLAILGEEVRAVRLTPWRGIILEGSKGASDDPADPRLTANACPGAPACPQASVATRNIAAQLAPHVAGLHVSGCAKGCAHPGQAAAVLTGRDGRFDLAFHARAGAPPVRAELEPQQILALFGAS